MILARIAFCSRGLVPLAIPKAFRSACAVVIVGGCCAIIFWMNRKSRNALFCFSDIMRQRNTNSPAWLCRANMPPMQARSLTIEEVPGLENGPHIFRLSGPLILTTMAEFQVKVRAVQSHHLIFDFTNVPYLDSAGIGALVGIYVRHQRDEDGVSLVGVNDRVRASLELTHIEHFFRFFDSLGEAEAKCA